MPEEAQQTPKPVYQPPTIVVLGSLKELTKTGAIAGKEHGGNGRLPVTASNT